MKNSINPRVYLDRDGMVKSLLEDIIKDFLRMMVPDAEEVFDLKRRIIFLNTQLRTLSRSRSKKNRRDADLVFWVHCRDGSIRLIIINLEIQGYKDPDFAGRLFTQYYRLWDKYHAPVICFALYTDDNPLFFPKEFFQGNRYTSVHFKFMACKVDELPDEELSASSNPCAIVLRIIKLSLKKGKVPDERLIEMGEHLAQELSHIKMSKYKRDAIFVFLNGYIDFEDRKNVSTFEQRISDITFKKESMGIKEYVQNAIVQQTKDITRRETRKEEKESFVKNLLTQTKFSPEKIAQLAAVSVVFVNRIRKQLAAHSA